MGDDIARIGFAVETAGLEQGTQGLNRFNQAQKNVTQGARELNAAQIQALQGSRAGVIGLSAVAKAMDDANASQSKLGQGFSLFSYILANIENLFHRNATAAGAVATAHGSASAATSKFREAVHTLDPILVQAGGSMGALGPIAMAARAGLLGLATAITGSVIVALENAGDEADKARGRLQVFFGMNQGNSTFAQMKTSADAARNSVVDLSAAVESLALAQQQEVSNAGFRAPPGQSIPILGMNQNSLVTATTTLSQAGQMDRETATAALTAIKALNDGMAQLDTQTQTTTGLTLQLFDNLRKTIPTAGNLIAQSFGMDVEHFRTSLSQGAISVTDFIQHISQMGPQTNAAYQAFMKSNSTAAQGFDALKTSARNLLEELGKTSGITAVRSALDDLSGALKTGGENAQATLSILKGFGALAVGGVLFSAFGLLPATLGAAAFALRAFQPEIDDFLKSLGLGEAGVTTFNEVMKTMIVAAAFAVNPFAGIIAFMIEFRSEIQTTISKIQELLSWEQKVGGSGTVAGTEAGASLGAIAGGIAGGALGFVSPIPGGTILGAGLGSAIGGAVGGAVGGGIGFASDSLGITGGQSSDNGIQFVSPPDTTDLPQFASGGLSTVSGTGGTDSQLVQFMATPGEVVAVGTPGHAAPSVSATTDPASQIVTSITGNKLSITDAINQMSNSISQLLAKISTQQQATAAAPSAQVTPGGLIPPASISALPHGFQIAGAMNLQGGAPVNILNHGIASGSAFHVTQKAQPISAVMGSSPAGPTFSASAPASPVTSGFYDAPNGGFSAPPNSVFPSSGYTDTSGLSSGDYSPFSDSSYASSAFDPSTYSSSYDSSADYSSMMGSNDYGFFATGGSFTVGSTNGRGGTDSQFIGMHVTPGENVSVSKPDNATPDVKAWVGRDIAKVKMELVAPPGGTPYFQMSRSQLARFRGLS